MEMHSSVWDKTIGKFPGNDADRLQQNLGHVGRQQAIYMRKNKTHPI